MSFGNYWDSDDKSISMSPWPLVGLALCLVFVLALRLFSIQVLKYDYFAQRSEAIRIKREVIEAPRGCIYDRNGQVLAENEMSYSITVDPFMRESLEESVDHLHTLVPDLPELMNIPENEMVAHVKQVSRRSNNPEKIIRDADFRLLSIVEEYNRELEGLGGTFDQLRHYPYGPMAAHVIGYMGELTRKEYERLRGKGYGYGHSIGRYGVERYYEDVLKGKNGTKFVEMNYLSRKLDIGLKGEVTPIPPVPGDNLTLTLDIRLQAAAQEAFGDTETPRRAYERSPQAHVQPRHPGDLSAGFHVQDVYGHRRARERYDSRDDVQAVPRLVFLRQGLQMLERGRPRCVGHARCHRPIL